MTVLCRPIFARPGVEHRPFRWTRLAADGDRSAASIVFWRCAGAAVFVAGFLMLFWLPFDVAIGGSSGTWFTYSVGEVTTAGAGAITATYGALLCWTARPRLLLTAPRPLES